MGHYISNAHIKKELSEIASNSSMPLRHIGVIVIWEGNYNPDITSIGRMAVFHELFLG
jgi:hypothetical protein